ncbi:hypothetical protein DITRI_Ditri20bG0051900 [Diplodiscus trichospermus]
MDPRDATPFKALVRLAEVALEMEREKTRLMEESLGAELAALEAKERERSLLLEERGQFLAVKEAGEKLLADFLKADGN